MTSLPSLKQLRYLVALDEHLNFTRAAEVCFVGQSTLSAGLKELESVLGVTLVERDRQNVALTTIGHAVALRARQLLAAAEDMVALAAEAAQPMSGTVRLGVIPTIAPFVLPTAMPLLREQFPKIRFALREDLTANLLDRLARRELDMALIALPFETPDMMVRQLYPDEFWLVAREGDAALKGRTITSSVSWSDRLLLLEEGHCLRDHALQACGRAEVASVDGLEATSLLTLLQMVESGLGLALIPEMAIKSGLLNHTGLIARPLAAPAPKRQIALVTRNTFAQMDVFEAVAELLKKARRKLKPAAT
jgi:LysR family hydrogen peroxide-inducible transcriptional activator